MIKKKDPLENLNLILSIRIKLRRIRRRIQIRSAVKIQKVWRGRQTRIKSYLEAFNISEESCLLYINDVPQFIHVLGSLKEEELLGNNVDDLCANIYHQDDPRNSSHEKYLSIRIIEEDRLKFSKLPLIQLAEPTYRSQIKKKKPHYETNKISVSDLYFCPNPAARDSLRIIKMRNSRVSLKNAMDSLKKDKYRQTRNNPYFTDNYMDLFIFKCPSVPLLHNIVLKVRKYNRWARENGETVVLLLFEKLMKQVSAATRIQMNFRTYLTRKQDSQKPLLIDQLVLKRAIFCIQQFWRNYKMKRRLIALSEINKIIRKVDSPKIYIEKNIYIYMNILTIIEKTKSKCLFHEQNSSFMFAHDVLYVNAHPLFDGILRYPDNLSCPDWFILDLFKCPKFYKPELVNQPLALFHHATETYGEIKKYSDIVDMNNKNMDMEVPVYFLEIHCKNIEEARKRICTLAYSTYDMKKSLFVKMFTRTMLEDPFFYSNIRKCWKHFGIESVDVDLATMSLTNVPKNLNMVYTPTRLEMCPHSGIIVTQADKSYLKGKYDKLKFANK